MMILWKLKPSDYCVAPMRIKIVNISVKHGKEGDWKTLSVSCTLVKKLMQKKDVLLWL